MSEILESLNFLDILILLILVIISLFASVKGLFKNIASLVTIIFIILLAGAFAESLQHAYVDKLTKDPIIAYLLSFLLVMMAASMIISAIMKVFVRNNKEKEPLPNVVLSFFVALLKNIIIASIIISSLSSFVSNSVTDSKLWENSVTIEKFTKLGDYLFNVKVKVQETNIKDYVPEDVAQGAKK